MAENRINKPYVGPQHGSKKGYVYFLADAIIAVILLMSFFIYLKNFEAPRDKMVTAEQYSLDISRLLRQVKVIELDDSTKQYLMNETASQSTDENLTIGQQIAVYFIMDEQELAGNLTRGFINKLLPYDAGYSVSLCNGTGRYLIYSRGDAQGNANVGVSKIAIMGFSNRMPFSERSRPREPFIMEIVVWIV